MANKPKIKVRHGHFQITLWERTHTRKAKKHYQAETQRTVERICIERGTYNHKTGEWDNQRIWLGPQELRDLAHAMDEFDEAILDHD